MKLTVAALTAIASVSAIQTQADASAEWGYYNPWAQQSQGGYYGGSSYSSPFGYGGDSKVQRLQRDVSYLVKQNSALKTRLAAAAAALTELEENGPTVDTSALEARVAAL